MNQTSIFDIMYPKYKITKPIRLIEMFSGYGSQALALKYLGVPFEHWRTCEWAIKSIQAYKDIHFTDDNFDYSQDMTKEDIINILYQKGISSNYNEPMTLPQIKRLSESQLRTIYNNIVATRNMVNIQQVTGTDLQINLTNKYDYILTYSFPCQDLSLAGKGKGMSDTSTRSGMLWEVERILTECHKLESMPQILLMENVPQVHSLDNMPDFHKWQVRLEELGYKNYFQDLIATDYGIPQTRNRCFMVSILGDYSYTFPKPIPLKLKLKDMLEDNVDEKYYLSDKMINCFLSENKDSKFPRKERFLQTLKVTNKDGIAATLCTAGGTRCTDNYILKKNTENYIEREEKGQIQMNCRAWKDDKVVATLNTGGETKILENKSLQKTLEQNDINNIKEVAYIDSYNKKIKKDGLSSTITTRVSDSNNTFLLIKNATKQGYLEATDGDGIDISSRMEYHRGNVQKDKIQTLTTSGSNDRGVVIGTYQYSKSDNFMQGKDRLQLGKEVSDTLQTTQKEGVVTIGNYSKSNHNASRIVDQEHSAPTVMENHGTVTATQMSDLRIRKLTPRECFRLMGVKDDDFEKCAKNQSDSSLYHLAGDSIVVNVLMAIFESLL